MKLLNGFMASDLHLICLQERVHISNLKENITVSDAAFFNHTEQNTQEGKL